MAERYPEGTEWLLPSPPSGQRNGKGGAFHRLPRDDPARSSSATSALRRSVRVDGELALGVHPHLFRHHVGTSMVNEKIPLTVIQKVLDHGSIEMTAHYARLHDETVKQEVWRWHERVNIRGERIALPVDGPLQEAAWMKERIARAKQALPNGYCGLPLVQSCPHPNACLSCESFLTDGSFRAVHEQQHGETRRLLEKARENNSLRLIEVLERDEQSLTRILEGLDAIEADYADGGRARPARPRRSRRGGGRLMGAEPARRPLADAAARRTLEAEQRVARRAARARSRGCGDHVRRRGRARAGQPRVSLPARRAARRRSRRCAPRRPRPRRACRSASAPATRRCAPGCARRLMRASASARRSPGCARSSRSRTAACASWSSTAGYAAREPAGAVLAASAAEPIGAGGGPGTDHLRQRGHRLHDRPGGDRADRP